MNRQPGEKGKKNWFLEIKWEQGAITLKRKNQWYWESDLKFGVEIVDTNEKMSYKSGKKESIENSYAI